MVGQLIGNGNFCQVEGWMAFSMLLFTVLFPFLQAETLKLVFSLALSA